MIQISPFKGTRPNLISAESLIAPSSDYLSEEKSNELLSRDSWNYINILNPPNFESELDEKKLYQAGKEYFLKMKNHSVIKQDHNLHYYIYRIKTINHQQTGFIAVANIKSIINQEIKGHELTYTKRVKIRADQMLSLNAQIGPIYVTYLDQENLDDLIETITFAEPVYDFTSFDQSHHTLWCLDDQKKLQHFSELTKQIKYMYIADGHHRADAMKKIYEIRSSTNPHHNGLEKYNNFMISAFPKSQLKIFDYNRVVKDLNNLSEEKFYKQLNKNFRCQYSPKPVLPAKSKEYGMYHDGKWYRLNFTGNVKYNNLLDNLDINIIDKYCLAPILGIKDVVNDDRIRFMAGCHGLSDLEKKVDENKNSIAFSIYPITVDEVIEIANNNLIMPPKSTWFEPKPLDGLVVYEF